MLLNIDSQIENAVHFSTMYHCAPHRFLLMTTLLVMQTGADQKGWCVCVCFPREIKIKAPPPFPVMVPF